MDISFDLDQIESLTREILDSFPDTRIFLLKGPMGAGKTTLVQSFIKCLGLSSLVSSPTYTLVQDYSEKGLWVYHMDLYRAQSAQEIFDLGFWEYIERARYIFIEWPEMIETYLDLPFISLQMAHSSEKNRTCSIKESLPS